MPIDRSPRPDFNPHGAITMKTAIKLSAIALLIALMAPASYARRKKAADKEPVVWGMISNNAGCVIFKQGHRIRGMFWGVAVTTTTRGKLTVVETQNYKMNQKVIVETQANMNALLRRATTARLKYVTIPNKYSPAILKEARAMCKASWQQR